jgi:hypothetical protein
METGRSYLHSFSHHLSVEVGTTEAEVLLPAGEVIALSPSMFTDTCILENRWADPNDCTAASSPFCVEQLAQCLIMRRTRLSISSENLYYHSISIDTYS